MTNDAFDDLTKHFKAMAIELKGKGDQASVFAHSSDTGTEREEGYRTFLERHLPKTCDVFLGGYLFDLNGTKSSQMDVIVTSGQTPRFIMPDGRKHIAPLEGALAVAEIKSNLDKTSLRDSLERCASIPEMPNMEGRVNPQFKMSLESWQDSPYKIIFSYDGITNDSIINHLQDFYSQNSHIPLHRRPNIIHVLNKYMIVRVVPGISSQDSGHGQNDEPPTVGEFRTVVSQSDVSAMLWVITDLHRKAYASSHVLYKFDAWHDNIVMRLVAEKA